MKPNCVYKNFYTKDIKDSLFQQFGIGEFSGEEFTKITTTLTNLYEEKLRKCMHKSHGIDLLNLLLNSFDYACLLKRNERLIHINYNTDDPTILKQCYKYGLEVFVEVSDTVTETSCKENDLNEINCLLREVVYLSHTVAGHRIHNSGKLILSENNSDFGTNFINYYSSDTDNYQSIMNESLKIYREKYINEFNNGKFVKEKIKNAGLNRILKDKFGEISFEDLDSVLYFINNHRRELSTEELFTILLLKFPKIDASLMIEIINGLTLSSDQIEKGNNRFYKPNRSNRLYAKGLLMLKYKGELKYFWTPYLFYEGYGLFLETITYGNIPSAICDEKKIKRLQGEYTKSFEDYIIGKFCNNGWIGGRRNIGTNFLGTKDLILPEKIGEIDGIFISPEKDQIYIIEAKTNKLAAHTVQIGNELKKFRDENYFGQIKRKFEYIQSIKELFRGKIKNHLNIELREDFIITPLLITERPSINEIYNEHGIECINFIRLFERLGF